MKTLTNTLLVALALLVLAGCAPRGEIALSDANPDAYEATQGEDKSYADKDDDSDNGDDAQADAQLGGGPGFRF